MVGSRRGYERSEIAQLVGWIGVFAGLAGNLVGGLLSDWWQENTNQGRPMFLFGCALITYQLVFFIDLLNLERFCFGLVL